MRLRFPQLALACAAAATVTLAVLPPATASAQTSADWTTWLNSGGRSGYDSTETQITTSTAPNLTPLWSDSNAGSVSTEPIVASGVVYYGSWDGLEHAVNATTGAPIWSTNLGSTTDSSCAPPESGVASSATITSVTIDGTPTNVDLVAGGDASLYALNAATGAVIWSTSLGTPPDTFLWSSPLYYNGNVYEGISSFGDCPLVRGGIVEMSAATGAIENTLYTIPSGCVGASVWGSPAVDTATGDIYFGTGNGVCPNSPHPLVQAMVQTDSSLNVLSSWQVPASQQIADGDFGDSPTLFQTYISGVLHKMVGIDDKNGWYYAFDRSNITAGPLWEVKLGYGGGDPSLGGRGVIASSAYNGKNVLAASGVGKVGTTLCGGVAWALRPSNGGKIWKDCLPGAVLAPVTAVPGVEFVGAGNTFEAINASNGALLWSFPDTTAGSDFWSPASIDNGVVYVGNQDGNLYAFHT
jgi:outer membrane protein assembly factor BamB